MCVVENAAEAAADHVLAGSLAGQPVPVAALPRGGAAKGGAGQ